MQRFQWINNDILIFNSSCLLKLLGSRRGSKALAKLLPYFLASNFRLEKTYSELASILGYKTRAGAYKAMKKLVDLDVIYVEDNSFVLNLGTICLPNQH